MSDDIVIQCAELRTRVAELERKLLDVTSERDQWHQSNGGNVQKIKRLATRLEASNHDLDRAKSAIAELTNKYTRVTWERNEAVAVLTICRTFVANWPSKAQDLLFRIDASIRTTDHAAEIHQVRDRQ